MVCCIGQGSYGEVWLARNAVGTWRAVKVVYRHNFTDPKPYEREFSGIQSYEPISRTNEGLIDVLQIGRNDEEGYFYYVMELADSGVEPSNAEANGSGENAQPGDPLAVANHEHLDPETYVPKTLSRVILQRGRLSYEECLTLGLTLNLALGHLHRNGLIHRDVKPSNIVFVNGVPKLTDIGLVTDLAGAESFVGTEGFIPPEGPNSAQADLYALGKVLYEASMGKDRNQFPEPVTRLGLDGDSRDLMELNAVLVRACAPDPKQRYQRAEEMNADLALLHSGESVREKHALARRVRLLTRVGVVTIAVLVLAVIPYWLAIREARNANAATRREIRLNERLRIEAAKSKAVAQLLKETLVAARPSVAMGRDTTLLRELLENTARRLDHETNWLPEVESELRETLGQVYFELGDYVTARHMLQCALDLYRRDASDTEKRRTAWCLSELATVVSVSALGNTSDADAFAQEALAIRLRLPADGVLDLADSYQCLGAILAREQKTAESGTNFLKALDLRRSNLPRNDPRIAESISGLAAGLASDGQWPEAESRSREALQIYHDSGADHQPVCFWLLNQLALAIQGQKKFGEAEQTARRALELEMNVLSPDHPLIAASLTRLARIQMDEDKTVEAKTNLYHALSIWVKRLDNEDLEIADTVRALFDLLLGEHCFPEARQLYEQMYLASREPKAKQTLMSVCAHYLARTGDWPAAADLFEQLRELEPDNHEVYAYLAALYYQVPDLQAYRRICYQIVARFRSATNNPSIADRMAKSLLLVPAKGEDLDTATVLANASISHDKKSMNQPWFQFCKGLSELRLGHFDSAKQWMNMVRTQESGGSIRDVEQYMVFALAEHGLGNQQAATDAYERGVLMVPRRMRELSSGDIESSWKDWITAHALMREAKQAIEPAGQTNRPPSPD
jgi:tetratricopeptide (TPR) repeat protein